MSLIDSVSGETTELRLDDSAAAMAVVQGKTVSVKALRNIYVAMGLSNGEAAEKLTAGQLAVAISQHFSDQQLAAMARQLAALCSADPPSDEGEPNWMVSKSDVSFRSLGLYSNSSTCHLFCLLYTSPSPRDGLLSRMPSSA